jgi:hypothetical protein
MSRKRLLVLAWLLGAGLLVTGAIAMLTVPPVLAGPRGNTETGG